MKIQKSWFYRTWVGQDYPLLYFLNRPWTCGMADKLSAGDRVEVTFSKAGYTGPGELVEVAYGNNWLVKINPENGKNPIITVSEQHLTKVCGPIALTKKEKKERRKQIQYDPKDSFDETEEALEDVSEFGRGRGRSKKSRR